MTRAAQSGFTLIELLVVLVIMGIAVAAVGLSVRPDPLHLLRQDASHLLQGLQAAQAEALADGRPITWQADSTGFRFSRRDERRTGLDQFHDDPQLRPRAWSTPAIEVRVIPRQRVVLNAEWFEAALRLQLSDGQNSVSVLRTAAGTFRLETAP